MPSELSRENLISSCENNMLSSHVKISPLLRFHNKPHLSDPKNYLSKMVWYFIGVYIIKRTLLLVLNSNSNSKRNFVSPYNLIKPEIK